MRKQLMLLVLALTLCAGPFASLLASPAQAEAARAYTVYDDKPGADITDYSWAEHSLEEAGTVHEGQRAIRLNPSMGGALYLYSSRYFLTSEYNTLELWIHGGSAGGQLLNVLLQAGGRTVAKVSLNDYLADGALIAGQWQKVQIYLPPLKMPGGLFDGILLEDQTQTAQPDVYVDDIRLTYETSPIPNKPPRPVIEKIVAYDNALKAGFQWFGDFAGDETTTVHAGTYAIRMTPAAGSYFYLYKDRVLDTQEYVALNLWIHGGSAGGQQLDAVLKAGGDDVLTINLNAYVSGGVVKPGEWQAVSIPLAGLSLPDHLMDGIVIAGRGAGVQGTLYIDDIEFVRQTYEQPKLDRVTFGREALLMYAGNTETPKLTALFDNGYTEPVTRNVYWQSSAPDIVQVTDGRFTALAKGESVVTATYESRSVSLPVQVTEVTSEVIYDERLREPFDDWSWAKRNLTSGAYAHTGSAAIEMLPRWWQGVYFNSEESYAADDYYGFEFWIHGGAHGGQSIRFVVQDMNAILGSVVVGESLPEGIRAGEWQKVTVRLKDLDITEGYFNALVFQAWDEKEQQPVYIDDVALLRYKNRVESPKPPVTAVSVQIDTQADRRAINPDIYGVNYEEIPPENVSTLAKYPVVRWGGNAVTRYNWELNVQNHASDWFYMNLPKDNAPGQQLPNGSRSDQWIDQTLAAGSKVLLQVPTIGWTPKDRSVRYGFSVGKYGPQQQTECAYGGWWCNADAGNGIRPDGTQITNNDPRDTSKQIGPDFVTRWIKHIQSRVGNKVNYYALDNEPMLWPYTHRDVHPQMTTAAEVWQYTEAYGKAIKEADPNAKIFGPVVWGWCAYLYTAADGCAPGADYKRQGDKPFLEWYLEQAAAYERQKGVRLVDYLDIHYYPMEAGVAISEDESKNVSARRLKSLKSLYDPAFRDNSSWIWEPVRLIPRMKEMIDRTAPGTKLAISEYNFGNGQGISSGLAQAEALAIFGREGVDLATRWGQPLKNTPVEDAFKLYLDYDGQGGRIAGDSVRAVSSNVDLVGSYAIRGTDGKLYILLFNKDTAAKQVSLTLDGAAAVTRGQVYRFDAANRLGSAGELTFPGTGAAVVEAPARSATLIVASP